MTFLDHFLPYCSLHDFARLQRFTLLRTSVTLRFEYDLCQQNFKFQYDFLILAPLFDAS